MWVSITSLSFKVINFKRDLQIKESPFSPSYISLQQMLVVEVFAFEIQSDFRQMYNCPPKKKDSLFLSIVFKYISIVF